MSSTMRGLMAVAALAALCAAQSGAPAGAPAGACTQPGAQLTFVVQLPTGALPTARTSTTLVNSVSGVPLPGGVNNYQVAALTSCAGSQVCGSGNKYLAVISFNYGSGTSFISVATAAEQAYTSGSYQTNLNNVQGSQGLQLTNLAEVKDLCTGMVEAGAPLSSLAAQAPSGSQPACQPGVKLTFILQLPTGVVPSKQSNTTLVNAVSGLTSAFTGGINNIQAAGSSSCSVAACGTGNNFLASVSFSYAAGTSFNATAASAQRAYSSGALQNNLNSIQGKQGLLLLGLYQVLDLCSGAVEAGAALLDLTASAPGSSFLNNGLPTILVSFTVGAPSTVKATQATTGKTVANAISGVISGFGGYGLNNPTVVSFVNCTACAAPASTAQAGSGGVQATSVATVTPQLSYYTLTMTFAYNPGFTFAGLSGLFYAAFKASLYQNNLATLDKKLSLVAISQILDFDVPGTYVLQRSPPPPPAYLSERLLFNAAELEQVNYLSSFLFTYAPYYMQGVSICTSLPCNSIITIPYVPVTSDIITLDPSIDTSDQLAELIAVDGTIFGYYGNIATIDQQKALVLALAASFQAQGLFINPNNVKFFNVFYQALDLGSSPTGRRLLQGGAPVSACPATTNCSMSASIAIAPEDGVDAAEYALAMLNVTSTGILQQALQLVTGKLILFQPKAISVIAAADLTYAPPPPMLAPPPPPLTGRQITATFRISKLLNASELAGFKAALAQVLAPYGVVPAYITIGSPVASGLSYDYPVTTKVPGTTTPAALESYLQSDSGKSDLSAAITSNGGSFTTSLQSVSESSTDSTATSTACRSHFGHWCIDHSSVSRGGIIAIIVCVGFFVLCCLVLIPLFLLSAMRRRRSVK